MHNIRIYWHFKLYTLIILFQVLYNDINYSAL